MPILSKLNEVEYWGKRGEEARAIAEKSLMLGIGASYENIAKSQKTIADYEMRPRNE